jgi:hypothetical protein
LRPLPITCTLENITPEEFCIEVFLPKLQLFLLPNEETSPNEDKFDSQIVATVAN